MTIRTAATRDVLVHLAFVDLGTPGSVTDAQLSEVCAHPDPIVFHALEYALAAGEEKLVEQLLDRLTGGAR